jgi:hypothetical protein
MNWEAVAALGSVLSATVIAITVIFASRQVKVGARQAQLTNDQLNHLRRSTQLEGAMRIFDDMDKPEFREAVRFVVHDLRNHMQDPAFRDAVGFPEAASDSVHKENIVLRFFERVGAYVREGLLDGSLIYTVVPTTILSTWESLVDVVALQRKTTSQLKAENFEFLYQGTVNWSKEHGYDFQPFSEGLNDVS